MNTLTRIALVACLVVSWSMAAEEKVMSAKEKKARQLLALIKAEETATQMLDIVLGSMQENVDGGSEEFWKSFRAQVKTGELVDLLVPVYMDNLDESDLDGLIAFYESPVGRKFVSKQGAIMQASMEVGQKWGADLAVRAMRELEKQ